jgi:hypothetical protein
MSKIIIKESMCHGVRFFVLLRHLISLRSLVVVWYRCDFSSWAWTSTTCTIQTTPNQHVVTKPKLGTLECVEYQSSCFTVSYATHHHPIIDNGAPLPPLSQHYLNNWLPNMRSSYHPSRPTLDSPWRPCPCFVKHSHTFGTLINSIALPWITYNPSHCPITSSQHPPSNPAMQLLVDCLPYSTRHPWPS